MNPLLGHCQYAAKPSQTCQLNVVEVCATRVLQFHVCTLVRPQDVEFLAKTSIMEDFYCPEILLGNPPAFGPI